ncbi:hypothetical protein CFO_g3496 [Ceratocystis platani]|uniref:Copper acquisition factor BIM1-like domain-containing protein n=1 Tax=Ceratocystis fimbriata f. sp. platani TaxID=88771 RepID=A0A0F8BNN0_CERFI|nr:hypothetical protein CFO_g3496 [Ceratocystis platani]
MKFSASLLLAASASAHFTLTDPKSIGFNDDNEGDSPCGGFSVTSRDNAVEFPSGGLSFTVVSTHAAADWTFKAALLNNTDDFQYLIVPVSQEGLGTFCLQNIPGPSSWAGQEGVVQIAQGATDGSLYQCVAVTFTDGNSGSKPSACTNSSGISVSWNDLPSDAVIAGSSSSSNSSSSSSSSTSTSSSSAASSSPTSAAGQTVSSFGSAALLAAAAYLL